MENKQTAVEWLANQIAEMPNTYLTGKYGLIELSGVVDDKIYRINADIMYLIDEAKQMEKEQIKDAWLDGFKSSAEGWNGEMLPYYKDGEQRIAEHKEEYYNETYANDTTTGLPEEDSKRRAWHY
jgi:hypothetical protein